jgi:hypothetical protein
MKTLMQKLMISSLTCLTVACASHSMADSPVVNSADLRAEVGLIEGDYKMVSSTDKTGELCGDTTIKWTGLKPAVLMVDANTFLSDFNRGTIHERETNELDTCKNEFDTRASSRLITSMQVQTCKNAGQSKALTSIQVDGDVITYTYKKTWVIPANRAPILSKCVLKLQK